VYRGTYNGYNVIVDKFKDHGLVKVIWGHLKEFADRFTSKSFPVTVEDKGNLVG
jgi:hypothetical protein